MATILNERDKALQAATYRSKLTAVSITSTSGGFKTAKNGGSTLAVGTSATSITLTAAPNSVYTIAATYTWHYAVSSAPTTWLSLGITGTTATITNTAFLTALGTSSQIQYRCTVTEPLLDTAYGYYTVLYTLEPSETISVALTRTNAVLTAASDGSITSLSTNGIYNNTGTTITVTRGTTSLNYSATAAANTFSVAIDTTQAAGRAINTVYSSNTSTSWSFDGITGLSIDGAKVAFIITVYDASGVAVSPTIGREIVYGKVSNGVIGSSARAVNLTTTTQVFNYNSAGSTPSPSSTVVTATAQNIPTGTAVYYEFLVGTTSKQNTTTNTYTYTPTTAFSSMPEQITVKIRETSNSSPVLASDTMSMIGLKAPVDGTNAITAILSNEVQVLPASLSGAVSSYTGSGTEIRVYEGATELTYDGVGTANSTWKFTTTPTNITVGTTTDSGTFATVGVHSGVADATDLSSIVYTITGKNSAGTSFTITKNQNFSKAKKGDTGNNAVVYDIITSAPVITKASPDAATAGAYASITIQGKKYDGNTASNYGWVTVTANGDTEIATATDTSSTTVSLAPATTAGKTYYTIKLYNQAAVTGATLLDTQIVYVVFTGGNGTNAITGVLTNEVATVLADQSGNVDTYTGTGGTFFVYDGITDKTTSGSVTYSVAASSGLTISINSSGVYSITAITADLATATLRAVYGGVTIDKIYSVSKSKASATSPSIYPVLNYDFAGITLPTGAGVTSGITLSNSDNSTTTTMTTTAVDQYLTFSGLSLVPANSNVVSMRIKLISGTWEGKLYYDNVSHDITESYYKRIPKPAVGVWTTINLDLRTVEVYQTNGDTDYMTGGTVSALRFDFVSDTNAVVAIDYISVGKYGVAEATKSTTVYAYAWSTSTSAPARSGTGITGTTGLYTWSTGLVDNRPTGWTSYAPAAPGVGYTLYQLSLPIVDLATKLSTTVDWSTSAAVANTIGYKVDGSIGPRGQSYRTCYIVTTSGTAPATPTAAVGDAAPTGWSFQSTSTLTAGQYMYQSDGILTGMPDDLTSAASISWGPPYLSNLKVGTLQAISASLGTVQIASAGSLYSGKTSSTDVTHAGFFLGNESGTPKFNIGNADNSAGILWDGNNLTVKGSGTFSGSLNAADGTFSGALTADAINAVNTINLAGQSVTIPASSYTDGSIITGFLYTYTPRYNVLQSISSVSSGAPVQVFYSGAHSYYSNGNASAQLRATLGLDRVQGGVTTNLRTFTNIYTDSGMLSGVAAAKDNFCCIITDTPDAGEVTYNFWCNTTGYYIYVVSASSRCLLTLETKR